MSSPATTGVASLRDDPALFQYADDFISVVHQSESSTLARAIWGSSLERAA